MAIYEQVLDKYDWAEKHIHKLNAFIRELREIKPIFTSSKTNLETGEITYYIEQVPPIPSSVPLIVGDILHSLHGALDYLACGLVDVPTSNTKFPIAHNAETYVSHRDRVIPGLRKDACEELDRIRPYQGGDLLLWELHMLNIIDKHRLLLTMCIINPARTLTPDEMATYETVGPKTITTSLPSGIQAALEFVNKPPVPLDAGKELLTLTASQAHQNVRFYFAIGINEPGLAKGMPLNMLLDLIFVRVGRVIAELRPFLLR
jgi:hypothetical protein